MQFRKQKQDSIKRLSRHFGADNLSIISEYRSMITPYEFTIKEIEMYGTFAAMDMQSMQELTIDDGKLKELVVDALKLSFIYDPLRECLEKETLKVPSQFQLKLILRILFKGEFYRFIHNNENQLKILVNNRTTEANVKILVAGLLVYLTKRLTIDEVSMTLLFFTLEAALYDSQQLVIPMDSQKVIKVLRKIQRVIKPLEFKAWVQSVKSSKDFKGQVQAHHFLYLCSLTEKKFINGLGSIIFKPKIESLFKNLNLNIKTTQFQHRQMVKQNVQERRMIRGLSLVEPSIKKQNFSKEILKEFRLRDPSKFKRPDTASLRRHVSTFIAKQCYERYSLQNSNTVPVDHCQISSLIKLQTSKTTTKIIKKNMNSSHKTELKLKITKKPLHKNLIAQI